MRVFPHFLSQLGADAPAAIGGKILGLYFSASWCGPCHQFSPLLAAWYRRLKEQRNDFEIIFVSSDRSEVEFKAYAAEMPWLSLDYANRDLKGTLGQAFSVTGIPTLVWVDKDGSVITLDGRKKVVQEPDKFPWTADQPKAVSGVVGAYESLASAIDPKRSAVLNADSHSGALSSITGDSDGRIRSDADEQLIVNVAFNSAVKLHSFAICGDKDGPKKVSFFVNRSIGFEDTDLKPTQSFVVPNNKQPIQVNFVQFQKVASLAIFIESNQSGADATTLSRLQLFGVKQ